MSSSVRLVSSVSSLAHLKRQPLLLTSKTMFLHVFLYMLLHFCASVFLYFYSLQVIHHKSFMPAPTYIIAILQAGANSEFALYLNYAMIAVQLKCKTC